MNKENVDLETRIYGQDFGTVPSKKRRTRDIVLSVTLASAIAFSGCVEGNYDHECDENCNQSNVEAPADGASGVTNTGTAGNGGAHVFPRYGGPHPGGEYVPKVPNSGNSGAVSGSYAPPAKPTAPAPVVPRAGFGGGCLSGSG